MATHGIAPLQPGDLGITLHDPEFVPLVASILGDQITDSDGWNEDFNALLGMFDGGDDLLSAMADHIGLADFNPGDVDAAVFVPIASDTADFVTQGNPLFDGVATSVVPPGAGDNPPPPAPGPTPPGGPGNGGTSGPPSSGGPGEINVTCYWVNGGYVCVPVESPPDPGPQPIRVHPGPGR